MPILTAGPVELRNLVLAELPPCTGVLPGPFLINGFFDVFIEVSLDGGATWSLSTVSAALASTTLSLTTPPAANPRGFDTEMLSLNISGGTLPAGFIIRESPSRPSRGHTDDLSLGGGLFKVDSFFDVFVELSIDGGQSWFPSNQPTRLLLGTGNPTPAHISTWGEVKAHYR